MAVQNAAYLLILASLPAAMGQGFLGANPKFEARSVHDELHDVLSKVLGAGHGMQADRFAHIREAVSPLFRALPKNRLGRVSAPVMRYAVQRYFRERHGWIMKGFEPHALSLNVSDIADGTHILQSKLPAYMRTIIEQKFAHDGFALEDAAVMIAAVERLILDEVIRGVEISFDLNSRDAGIRLNRASLTEVLSSYLITEMLEGSASNATQHRWDKDNIREIYPHWEATLVYLLDIAENDVYQHAHSRNPFAHNVFNFEDAVRIAQRVSENFGPWSNHECQEMKSMLSSMDPHQTGRVKASDFYKGQGSWQFHESSEYLRQLGALDESFPSLGPQVIIPNYIAGLSNCIMSAPYYSVCCLNACDEIYQHLEAAIPASNASVAEIIAAVHDLPEFAERQNLSATLRTRLEEAAAFNQGKLALHGRLLAQWLHYAFPRDCPYPHMTGTINPMTPARYEEAGGEGSSSASDEEVEQFLQAEQAHVKPSPEAGSLMWNYHEVVLDASTPSDSDEAAGARSYLRMFAFFGMTASLVGLVFKELGHALGAVRPAPKAVEYCV